MRERGENVYSNTNMSTLDKIRFINRPEQYRQIFHDLGKREKGRALDYLNEDKLHFASLFELIPEIERLDLFDRLNGRNTSALAACSKVLKDINLPLRTSAAVDSRDYRPTLKWMFETGADDDGLSENFDHVMDQSAAALVCSYQDHSILPTMAELIFERHHKGMLIHDLTWSFFESRNVNTLKLVSGYLRSSDPEDVALACRLLHLPREAHGPDRYREYGEWYRWNHPYLYATGESFQFSSEPVFFRVNHGAKYLGKNVSAGDGEPAAPYNLEELAHLKKFDTAGHEQQKLLADFSVKLRAADQAQWKKWMDLAIDEELRIAGRGGAS